MRVSSQRVRPIDVKHMGREHVICCWEVEGVLVDPGPQSCEDTLLAALGGEPPSPLLLTHIHFDHAGAAGGPVPPRPPQPVFVPERGAPHLIDPAKLVASAARLYGGEDGLARLCREGGAVPEGNRRGGEGGEDGLARWWGEVVPVPEVNLRVLEGGESGVEGAFRVEYTPAHASHHVCY